MPKEWTDKQERQYEHIKSSAKSRGEGTKRAEEIAARTVNKERAERGQTKTSKSGGPRSGQRGSSGPTREQLYNEAKKRNIKGRSKMTKAQLARALGRS